MNLHGIAAGAIGAVNPFITGTLTASTGCTTAADGTQVPAYAAAVTARIQVQALTYSDLQQTSGLNIQGEARGIYLYGEWNGVLRPEVKGGDLITFNSQRWLVKQVLEQWPDWCKVVAVRQL